MTPRSPASCHHELRPGTKVCLHCRRAEREATSARRQTLLVRTGLIAAVIGGCIYAGMSGLDAWKNRAGSTLSRLIASPAPLEAAPVPAAPAPVPPSHAVADPSLAAAAAMNSTGLPDSGSTGATASVEILTVSAPAAPAPVTLAPVSAVPTPGAVIAEGRTDLQNGMYAVRSGDTVTVYFDTPEARTRRPEKFEQIVRATLPQVHGPAADSILAGIAMGNLLGAGEFAPDQPMRAISLRGSGGESLSLVPQTRPGRDGPLVVAYRVTP